ncbi:hypothetical protein [Heyndrickxia oleronia]|nr:hypothetical protein [Heyndrickxia oleronia]
MVEDRQVHHTAEKRLQTLKKRDLIIQATNYTKIVFFKKLVVQ